METLERNEWADVAQLVEITSDAVIICELDGTILHVNIVCHLKLMAPRTN